jgi:hypothetical protein
MKTTFKSYFAACLGLLIVATTAARAEDSFGGGLESKANEIRIGYRIAPAALNVRGKNPLLVGLGSYIVNAQGACNDCHTQPNFAAKGNPYLGEPEVINTAQYLAGGRLFGPFKSKNLTPDALGRPAGLSFAQFSNLLRTGRDPDELGPNGQPRILQVMPWPVYGTMTNLDLRAIYEYLRSIPALPDNPNPSP